LEPALLNIKETYKIMNERKGFTLIELLVVIAIIALLMAILMPALRRAKEQAKRVYCASNLRQMGTALVTYCDDYDGRLPDLQDGPPWTTYVAYWKGTAPDKHIPVQFGLLYEHGGCSDAKVFYCPSNSVRTSWKGHRYDYYAGDGILWGTIPPPGNLEDDKVRTGYNYYPQGRGLEDGYPPVAKKITDLASARAVIVDLFASSKIDKGEMPHRMGGTAGLNALFADGHVYLTGGVDMYENIDIGEDWPLFKEVISSLEP